MMAHLFPFTDQPRERSGHRREATRSMRGSTRAGAGSASSTPTPRRSTTAATPRSSTRIPTAGATSRTAPASASITSRAPSTGSASGRRPTRQLAAADATGTVERSQNLRGVVDYAPLLRACLVQPRPLGGRGRRAAAEPPSAHRRRHRGRRRRRSRRSSTRMPERALPAAPCAAAAPGLGDACRRGRGARGARASPRSTPTATRWAASSLPELAVPLATHTGWNLRHPDIGGAEQLLVFAGATLPFHRTRAEREAAGDPRPSIEERYASRDDYLERVRDAARALARAGALPARGGRRALRRGGRKALGSVCRRRRIATPASPATAAGPRAPARGTSSRHCGTGASVRRCAPSARAWAAGAARR